MSHQHLKCILVTGATGNQGFSVADALLKAKKYHVVCLVKNPDSPLAKDLQSRGAKLVVGDLENPDDIRHAMTGCGGVFNVQNSWEIAIDNELKEGRMVALIAKELDVLHIIHTIFDFDEKITGIELPHANVKTDIANYMKEIELPYTFLCLRPFLQNFLSEWAPTLEGDEYIFRAGVKPDTPLAFLDTRDIGPIVESIFENRDKYLHKTIKLAGDCMTMNNFCKLFTQVTGLKARYVHCPIEHYIEKAYMFQAWEKFDLTQGIYPQELKNLCPNLHNVEKWLQETPWKSQQFLAPQQQQLPKEEIIKESITQTTATTEVSRG